VREHQRVDDDVLGNLLASALDHHDGVAAGGHDQIEFGTLALGEGRVDDKLAIHASHAHASERPGPRNVRQVQRGEAPVMASTSVGFSRSVESTVPMTCVSKRHPLGNSGRQGRSMRREVRISTSVIGLRA
jgi:hypothetical protein